MRTVDGCFDVAIVGAGICGLLAARRLQAAGLDVVVLEASWQPGGRMATVESDEGARADIGAQYFTVRDFRFETLVTSWIERRLVREWSRGFATADGSYYADGHPRYCAPKGMASLCADLAAGLQVHYEQRAAQIEIVGEHWRLKTGDSAYCAAVVILTPPVPVSLELLGQSAPLPPAATRILDRISYEPCLALLVQLDGPGQVPEPGGLWPLGEPISWIADNNRKGISDRKGLITIHAGPEFSEASFHATDLEISESLLRAAAPWLGDPVKKMTIFRWPYSKPNWTYHEPYLFVETPLPLIFAGDAFAGPRVEGAAISGWSAADRLLAMSGNG